MMCIYLCIHTYSGFSLLRLLEVPFKITSTKKEKKKFFFDFNSEMSFPYSSAKITSEIVNLTITAICEEENTF